MQHSCVVLLYVLPFEVFFFGFKLFIYLNLLDTREILFNYETNLILLPSADC